MTNDKLITLTYDKLVELVMNGPLFLAEQLDGILADPIQDNVEVDGNGNFNSFEESEGEETSAVDEGQDTVFMVYFEW